MLQRAVRGYDRRSVDAFLLRCARSLGDALTAFPELTAYGRSLEPADPVTARDVREVRFPVVLRGYDLAQVDALLRRVERVLAPAEPPAPTWAADPLPPAIGPGPGLRTTLRGYAREQVDPYLVRCAHSLGADVGKVPELAALTGRPRVGEPLRARDVEQAQFPVVLRGYDLVQVDTLLDRVQAHLPR